MKRIWIIMFAIISLFMVQFSCVSSVYAANSGNQDFDGVKYNTLNTSKVSCGSGMVKHIPKTVVRTTSIVYNIIQVIVPIILIIMGMITLVKAVSAGKDDEMKKAQMAFVKKLITGAIIFFMFVIVKLLISVAADSSNKAKIMGCADCFLNNKCSNDKK